MRHIVHHAARAARSAIIMLALTGGSALAAIPPELAPHVWSDSPLAEAWVESADGRVGVPLRSPDADRTIIRVVAPATATVRFGQNLLADVFPPSGEAFGTPRTLPVGTAPEGDIPVSVKYGASGLFYYILHRDSRNIIRFNSTTNTADRAYPLTGDVPLAMDITPDGGRLIVANFTQDTISIVDTNSGTETTAPVGNGPGWVYVVPGGARVLVGNTAESTISVVNLTTLSVERTISVPQFAQTLSGSLESGVTDLSFGPRPAFLGPNRVLLPARFNSLVAVIDYTTGSRTDIPTAPSPGGVDVSGIAAVVVAVNHTNDGLTSIIDPVALTVSRTIPAPAGSFSNGAIALNASGSRAVVALGNSARFLDLTTDTYGPGLNTANLNDLLVNPARTRAIGVGFSGAIIDLNSGTLLGRANDTVSCEKGAVNPVSDQATLISSPGFGDDFVAIETDNSPFPIAFGRSGFGQEGDIPRNAAVSPNGNVAVSSNVDSDNLSIFDFNSGAFLGYANLDARPGEVEIAPGNTKAVGVNLDAFTLSVVNLPANATVPVPSARRLAQVEIDSNGQFAYLSQVADGDGVRKFNLQTNSFVGGITPTGNMGSVGYSYSQPSQLALSPDNTLLAVPGPFDDRLDIVNTATMTVAQTFSPVGQFIARASWSPEGNELLVSDIDADSVLVFRRPSPATQFAQVGSIAVGDQPFDTVKLPNSNRAFVINWGTNAGGPSLGVLNTQTLTQTSTIPLPFTPTGMVLSSDASTISVFSGTQTTTVNPGSFTRFADGKLTVIDTATLAVRSRVDTGQVGAILAANPAGDRVALPGVSNNVLTVIGPACAADFNALDGVTVQDIFDFLTAWFATSPDADFNGAGGVTVQDIFDFLTAWFAGC